MNNTKKDFENRIDAFKEEIEALKKEHIDLSEQIYRITLTRRDGEGAGFMRTIALCNSIENAILVAEGLKHILPSGFESYCGDSHIKRRFEVSIQVAHPSDIREFVSREGRR